jgi:hypothetical protein
MPTTRAARSAARAAERRLVELPTDALGLVLYQLTLAHDIAAVAPTCHVLCDAVKIALKLRPFSGEIIVDSHAMPVRAVAVADGRIITASSFAHGGTIKCGVRTISHAHAEWIRAVAVLPAGARFVSGSDDRTAKLWTLDGAVERTFDVGSEVYCAAALPDSVHFVVGLGLGDHNGDVRLYHVDGTLVHTFKGHANSVWALAVTPDGQYIISCSDEVNVWSVANKSLVSTCGEVEVEDDDTDHAEVFIAVAAMPDGQRFLSGGWDHTVRVWLLDGTLKNTFELHADWVNALVALPDNQHALSGSDDRTIKLFNVNDGAVLRTFENHTYGVYSLALLPDGLRFVSGSYDKTARIAYHGLVSQ